MLRDRGRLVGLVPLAQLLAPELAGEDLLRPREALRDLLLGSRQHRLVADAVDVAHLRARRSASRRTTRSRRCPSRTRRGGPPSSSASAARGKCTGSCSQNPGPGGANSQLACCLCSGQRSSSPSQFARLRPPQPSSPDYESTRGTKHASGGAGAAGVVASALRTGRVDVNIIWGLLITVAVAAVSVGVMLFVRARAPEGSYFTDGDRASGVFGVLATGFSILLGFVVFLAFTSYDNSRAGAETEALMVLQQVETAQSFPPPARPAGHGRADLLREVGRRRRVAPHARGHARRRGEPVGRSTLQDALRLRAEDEPPSNLRMTRGWVRRPHARRGVSIACTRPRA